MSTLFEAVFEDAAISNYENLTTDYGGENLSKIFVNFEKIRIGVVSDVVSRTYSQTNYQEFIKNYIIFQWEELFTKTRKSNSVHAKGVWDPY